MKPHTESLRIISLFVVRCSCFEFFFLCQKYMYHCHKRVLRNVLNTASEKAPGENPQYLIRAAKGEKDSIETQRPLFYETEPDTHPESVHKVKH